ncbi:MAG: Outer rane lipoproteinsorting protein, partial [Verrucomicrobiota bacterium]
MLQPAECVTNRIALTNYLKNKVQSALPLRIEVSLTSSNWVTAYVQPRSASGDETHFMVVRAAGGTNEYVVESVINGVVTRVKFEGASAAVPIGGSEFTLADVGMEFLRWPTQRLLVKEVFHSQSCDKLESIAPADWTNGYVRVVSWFA